MGFTEEIFVFVFLPLSVLLYVTVAQFKMAKLNNVLLVLISTVFYAWASLDTLAIFLILIVGTYLLGEFIYATVETEKGRRWVLISSAIFVLVLIYYKYIPTILGAFCNEISSLAIKKIVPPIGISFVTFEAVSYLVDIYRGAKPGTLLEVATFMTLFPKLVSGPIVQWKDFSGQLIKRDCSLDQVVYGIDRVVIGLAKKAIIADTFGAQIQSIEQQMEASGVDAITMWLRALLFFFQLYYDFSGYSDIAIGLCSIFGFKVKDNFNFPYTAQSVTEFWRKWHISLGTWFREYVYIPLGGNRKGNVYINLFVVFALTGIWHGANWTFVLWGILNGVAVVLERMARNQNWYQKIPAVLKWLATMAFIFFAWIIFMSDDLPSVWNCFEVMFGKNEATVFNFTWRYYFSRRISILLVVSTLGAILKLPNIGEIIRTHKGATIGYRCSMLLLLLVDILFIVNSTYSPFLYFQF